MNNITKLFIFVFANTFMGLGRVSSATNQDQQEDGRCNGTVSGTLVYGDGKVVGVESNGNDPVSFANIAQFNFSYLAPLNDQVRFAGENGVTGQDDGHRILLFPGGYSGQHVVHLFNYTSSSSSAIDVYCQPLGLAYRPGYRRIDDAIVGHCITNTTARAVPYFKLGVRNGKWTDVSRTGLYSNPLDTTNLTNAVILQYEDDFDPLATKLYFSEGTKLHEIDLGRQAARTFHSLDGHQIYRLVPAVNSSFPVLRVAFYNSDNSRYYHRYFSSQSGFMDDIFDTDYMAFDSFDHNYLVTFANLKTLSIIRQDGTSQQFHLNVTLDDPIQCHNMAIASNVHYLICLADDGLHPVIINITEQVTSKIIPVFNSQIVRIGMLTKDTFYLLTEGREMLFYVVNSVVASCLGRYALRRDIDYVVTSATSNITCSSTTNEPDGIDTTDSGLHLGIILAISFIAALVLLLILLLILFRAGVFIFRAKRKDTPSQHNQVLEEEPTQGQPKIIETALDDNFDTNDNDRDGTSYDDNTSGTITLPATEDNGGSIATTSITERDPLTGDENNERFIQSSHPEEAASDSDTEIQTLVEPNPYVIPFISSAKHDDEKFEPRSSQPELFVAGPVQEPVQSTKDQSSPAPDMERRNY